MAQTGIFHHVGTFFLFAATILLLITTISSPVINNISVLNVRLTNSSSVTFGTFGHCILNTATMGDMCSPKTIGYNPAYIMGAVEGTGFSTAGSATADGLTNVMILHPIACVLSFIAFLLALGSGVCGALLASLVSALAWVITLVVMATDFASFGIIRNNVNADGTGSAATWGVGMWTCLAAMILLFFATFIVLFTCFSARKHKRAAHVEKGYANGATVTTHKRHFWQRRNRY